ncbi:hypothetical protein HMPREF9442_03068 [Paraprevotella xylaniphila YIT 11841]|uniref:Uncharacterized protein n=1 Tax=Paraprevotella xylaniphila YIT 11841 TaxID=762982 RepID=F3QXX8_9BACT|nr:hypothetical protein HMPREF9442_03068 [Paraprevotella xylaniphila YIT 11841]
METGSKDNKMEEKKNGFGQICVSGISGLCIKCCFYMHDML